MAEAQQAARTDPGLPSAYFALATGYTLKGYWARRGFALSGKRGNDYWHLGLPLKVLRADDELRELLLQGERRFPEDARLQFLLSMRDALHGRRDDARARGPPR